MYNFELKVIRHKDQRLKNGDVADYIEQDRKITISVSDLGNWNYNFLVFVHELIEVFLLKRKGFNLSLVDKWDNEHPDEMGDHPKCPYRAEHNIAEAVERVAALLIGVDWNKYNKRIEYISEKKRYDSN